MPFFIRTGKLLPETQTEVRLVFKPSPNLGFGLRDAESQPDQLVMRLDPSTGVRILLNAQRVDAPKPRLVSLDMEFATEGGEGPTPYEVLLLAALKGGRARFGRQDTIEAAWRVMQPLVDHPSPIHSYRRERGARRRPRRSSLRTAAGEAPGSDQPASVHWQVLPRGAAPTYG